MREGTPTPARLIAAAFTLALCTVPWPAVADFLFGLALALAILALAARGLCGGGR